MKKKLFALTLLTALAFTGNSQSKKKNLSLGLHFGTQEYRGDLGDEFFSFKQHAAYGVSLTKYLTPTWDVMGMVTFSNLSHSDSLTTFNAEFLDLNIMAKLKLNNGKVLKENSVIAPYLFLGFGDGFSRTYQANQSSYRDIAFNFLGGVGFNINFNESWGLNLMSKYTYMWNDEIDARKSVNKYDDQALTTTAGLVYNFTLKKDADNDGVVDKKDKCPNTFGLAKFNGCPDTDADGVQDSKDDCPKVAGTLNGCPDTDKDGIADKDDSCPTVAGLAKYTGCPDTDKDGVIDSKDKCPNTYGTLAGCPDTDKDGVADKDDSCPKVFGTVKGCPDSDKDGVIDSKDKCPKVAGVASNNGCPVKKEADKESKEAFKEAMEGLFFNSGSAVIKKVSYPVLDNVARILKSHPTYKVQIDGHTDNTGNVAKNLSLSKARANAAKQYLINKGITGSRLSSEGYGITKPRADNNTPAGRQLNRRVEFKATF